MSTQTEYLNRNGKAFLPTVCFLFVFLFFCGCESKDSLSVPNSTREVVSDDAANSDTKATAEKKSVPESDAPSLTDQKIAEMLSGVTEEFTETFQGENADNRNSKEKKDSVSAKAEGKQTPGKKKDGYDELSVKPELKEKYIRDNTPVQVPIIERGASADSRPGTSSSGNTAPKAADSGKYLLQYHFQPGKVLRWKVLHQVNKKLVYAGKPSEIETISRTERRWIIGKHVEGTRYHCEYMIDSLVMYQQEENKDPVSYDSRTDERIPKEFAIFGTDKTIGKILERFQVDAMGLMTNKEKLVREFHGVEMDSRMLVPFPKEEVAVGDSWTIPYVIYLKGRDGNVRSFQATQKFTLEKVMDNLATIRFRTILLSVVTDPVIEGQLAEKLFTGYSRFDMKAGRTLQTELDFSKSVANAMGDASHLEYHCRMIETLVRE